MKALLNKWLALSATLLLASCGGGGGGGGDNGGFTPPGFKIAITSASNSTTPFSLVDLTVRVTDANNNPLGSSQVVKVQVAPTSVGLISTPTPSQGSPVISDWAETVLGGGLATFRFHSRSVGQAIITASMPDPNAAGRTITTSTTVNVIAGAPGDRRLVIEANTSNLPLNRNNVRPFPGSPFMAELRITQRLMSGEFAPSGRDIGLSASPLDIGAVSILDDPSTTTINEFTTLWGQIPTKTTGGIAIGFAHSSSNPGVFTIRAQSQDPETQETLVAEKQFTVANIAVPTPANIVAQSSYSVYAQGTAGINTVAISATLFDSSPAFVPDPVNGSTRWNNTQFEIISLPLSGAKLTAIGADGSPQSGSVVKVASVRGTAEAAFNAGARTGVYVVKITADRADNNVDNGIQDAVFHNSNVVVSDGKVFDLDITSPLTNAIVVNPPGITATPGTVPPALDGSYSLTVSALVTDREGNPVIPGTEVRFGLIDSPQIDRIYAISGLDGNPQEGGTGFTAPTGAFQTAGGGAGPGDTLLVFGEDSIGNRDLESARRIASVNSQTSLTTTTRFNFNDDTGAAVNNGPVLPYIIGRAVDANITVSAVTNNLGVATAQMTYPVGKLGKVAMVWAQASGDVVSGTPEIVTDVEPLGFSGVAPARVTVSPKTLPGNTITSAIVCIEDALRHPIAGVNFRFAFTNLQTGTGVIDGQTGGGVVQEPTDESGCVDVTISTSGIQGSSSGGGGSTTDKPKVTFTAANASDFAEFSASGGLILQALPSAFVGDGQFQVTLRLLDSAGNPVPNVQISATCEATTPGVLQMTTAPGSTNAQGQTSATIGATGFSFVPPASGGTGKCTFKAPGAPDAEVTWTAINACTALSPPAPGCPPP